MLYHRYKNLWFAICLRYNHNQFDAEDCLQNALVKIFSKLGQFDSRKGRFKDWANRIVVNENLLFLRQRTKDRKMTEGITPETVSQPESSENTLSPERMTRLIQKLPEGYRNVFNLYVMEGYNHKEIGQILDISVGTSKSQLHKARKMLQQELEVLL